MKRTLPQKVKLVPSCVTETEVDAGQTKQTLPEVNRRARTSAAMIGLALSMGAHSLLLTRPGDSAMAAEPVADESTATAVPSAYDVATLSSSAEAVSNEGSTPSSSAPSVIEHTVQEGQTIWQLARFYGVDAATIAAANNLSVNAVLTVGQVLKVPTSSQVARVGQPTIQSDSTASVAAEYYGPITSKPSATSLADNASKNDADTALKVEQEASLNRLQEKRENLRHSLSQLKAAQANQPVAEQAPASPQVASSVSSEQPAPVEQPQEQTVATLTPEKTVPTLKESEDQPEEKAETPAEANDEQLARANQTLPKLDNQSTVVPTIPAPRLAEPPANAVAPSNSDSYRVAPGDTLSAIARAYGVSQKQLIEANNLANPNVIRVDQVLIIPQQNATAGVNQPFKVASAASTKTLPDVPIIGTSTTFTQVATPKITAGNPNAAAASEDARVSAAPSEKQDSIKTVETAPSLQSNYIEGLRMEIVKLREKYKATPASAVTRSNAVPRIAAVTSDAASLSTVERVNPEFNPDGAKVSKASPASSLKLRRQVNGDRPGLAPAATRSKPQQVATAPMGSQNYAPLNPAALGQMVSPDLPPLGSGDNYLPKGTGKFAGYIWPAKGVLTSGFGWRWGRMHKGIDIAAPVGTPIVAAAPGVISYAGWNSGGYGNLVEITHPDGSVTLYAHNDRILVREGQQVDQGQQIAEMGSTGYSTGPHSHFEVHLPGQGAVNPMAYLPRSGA